MADFMRKRQILLFNPYPFPENAFPIIGNNKLFFNLYDLVNCKAEIEKDGVVFKATEIATTFEFKMAVPQNSYQKLCVLVSQAFVNLGANSLAVIGAGGATAGIAMWLAAGLKEYNQSAVINITKKGNFGFKYKRYPEFPTSVGDTLFKIQAIWLE